MVLFSGGSGVPLLDVVVDVIYLVRSETGLHAAAEAWHRELANLAPAQAERLSPSKEDDLELQLVSPPSHR